MGGKVITDFGPGGDSASGVAIQSDGRMVAVGSSGSGDFGVARYLADGSLDPSFGIAGKVTTDFGGASDEAFAVAIQPDGKIVAAGDAAPAGGCCLFALARYNPDGTLDPTFDTDGRVTTPFGGNAMAFDVAIQADGRILAVGSKFDPFENGFAVARYNPDGSLDATFGAAGKVLTPFGGVNDGAHGVAIQPDGKIIAAGAGGAGSDFLVARYNPDGSLDATFGTAGKVITDFGGSDGAHDVGIQADGKIVVAGLSGDRFAVARYRTDGSLDPTFDGDGRATIGENIVSAEALAIQPDGRIVVVGTAFTSFDPSYALARFNPDGSVDATFGTGGEVTTNFGNPGDVGVLCPAGRADCSDDMANDVAIQADGKIVAVGGGGPCSPPCAWTLARYLVDSTPPSTTTTTPSTTTTTSPSTTTTTTATTSTTVPRTTTTTTTPADGGVCERVREARDRVLAQIDQTRHTLMQRLSGTQLQAGLARLDQTQVQIEATFALVQGRAGCSPSTGGGP